MSDNLNDKTNMAVFAGIIGRRTAEGYELRKKGIIPQEGASLRETLSSYISNLQQKAAGRNDDADVRSKMQKTALDAARTESTWLDVREKRGTLNDKTELADIFTSGMIVLRDEILQIGHDFPEVKERLTQSLTSFAQHGRHLAAEGEEEINTLLDVLTTPVTLETETEQTDEPLNTASTY